MLSFIRAWFENPLRVGAIAPSSDSLARVMTQGISLADGPVLELGAGTGSFTRALLARGFDEAELTLVESGAEFAGMLELRYPRARVLRMDASRIGRTELFGGAPVGAVVSGLPLLAMTPGKVIAVLGGAFHHLRRGGSFYQFTYGPRCPVPKKILDRLELVAVRVGCTIRNLPPASVFCITRPGAFKAPNHLDL